MDIKHLILAGLFSFNLLANGCSSSKLNYQIEQAIKSGDASAYIQLRNQFDSNLTKIGYDLGFLRKNPNNEWINAQIELDEERLEKLKGEHQANILYNTLLHLTNRKELALRNAHSLEKKLDNEWFSLSKMYFECKNNYLLGLMYSDKNDWLTATEYLLKMKYSGGEIGRSARKILKNKGIVVVKSPKFGRPFINEIAKQFSGEIILPYSLQTDPSNFSIKYQNSELAKKDFLKCKEFWEYDEINQSLKIYDYDYTKRTKQYDMFSVMIQQIPAAEVTLPNENYIVIKNWQKINEGEAGIIAGMVGGFIIGVPFGEAPVLFPESFEPIIYSYD